MIFYFIFAACRELSNGISAVVDATESGFTKLRTVADHNSLPYFRVEPTIGPFARAAADYVLNLNATDAALIFQNEAGEKWALIRYRNHNFKIICILLLELDIIFCLQS
jgi:hypothetical protein